MLTKNFLDSLSIVRVFPKLEDSEWKVIDVGSGAGFPGIPLKIAFPKLRLTLVESLQKKARFLEEAISLLCLSDVKVVRERAEDLGQNGSFREQYDLCVSRAVASLPSLCELCLPLVKKEGYFLPYKAEKAEEEIRASKRALQLLGGKMEQVERFSLGDEEYCRVFPVIRKTKNTPAAYPRRAGLPVHNPLL